MISRPQTTEARRFSANTESIFVAEGGKSLESACQPLGLNPARVLYEIENAIETKENLDNDYNLWPLSMLADYINETHHSYVPQAIGAIAPILNKVVEVHGANEQSLFQVKELFEDMSVELAQHMNKEEMILFPYVKMLEHSKNTADTEMEKTAIRIYRKSD